MIINKNNTRINQTGFTLLEVTIVVVIVSILLGFTVALIPKQQELKRYKEADREMDKILDAIVGFAQVYGRLPCPSAAASAGVSAGGGNIDCVTFGGFVPSSTLGFNGRLNTDSLLSDPWGNPYRYYVSNSDADGGGADDSDFVINGEMQEVGLVDVVDVPSADLSGDDRIDLDGQFLICDSAGSSTNDLCTGAIRVFGNPDLVNGPPYAYEGAIAVLLSHGKSGDGAGVTGADHLENRGTTLTNGYYLKNVAGSETTFVRRTTGLADDFDDIVKWISPSALFSKMIEADQLP
ncbi:MAG: prepilin-type N-terminal cleavage/methylation domain-containing protein [Gammaproteobacteria bacterium]